MIIKTERLVLEPLGTKHFETTCVYSMSPENTKYMVFLPCDSTGEVMEYLEKCERQWEMQQPEYLDAALILDGMHIGAVSIELLDGGTTGELGWILDPDYHGRGYAYEAARAFMKYFADRFSVRRFIAHADAENKASVRVMEKLGMHCIGISGGRKNRSSDEERMECTYELVL